MLKKIIVTVLIAILLVGAVVGAYFGYKKLSEKVGQQGQQGQTPTIRDKGAYKDFTVTDKDGKTVKLSEFVGKPIVINFWASWCGPCRSELGHFDKLAKEYEGKVTFLMVNLYGEDRNKVINFVKNNNYTFPLYFDDTKSGAKAYSVTGIPVTVFITAAGKVVEQRTGEMSEAVLRAYVKQLL